MSVPSGTGQHDTTTSSGTSVSPSPEVETFIEKHPALITHLVVPDRECVDCHRTMRAVAIFLVGDEPPIWHLKCPLHPVNDYAVVMNTS